LMDLHIMTTINISNITEIADIFDKNKVSLSELGSSTSSINVSIGILNDLEDARQNIDKAIYSVNNVLNIMNMKHKITSIITNGVNNDDNKYDNVVKLIKMLTELYKKQIKTDGGKYFTDLFTYIIENLYTTVHGVKGAKDLTNMMNDIIEEIKSEVLVNDYNTNILKKLNNKNRTKNVIQNLVQSNRLVYNMDSIPIKELMQTKFDINITGADFGKIMDNAVKLISTKLEKIGFIVINKSSLSKTASHVEHRLMGILSKKYITDKDLHQSSRSGINKKIIDRTETIKILEPDAKMASKLKDITIFGKECHKYVVLETIDGDNFRISQPWGIDSNNMFIMKDDIEYIINGTYPSNRVCAYNNIIDKTIMREIEEPLISQFELRSYSDIKTEDAYWNGVVVKLKNAIMEYISEKLKGTISLINITNLISKGDLTSFMISRISVLAFEEINDTNDHMSEFEESELLTSYYMEVMSLRKRMHGRMQDLYDEEYKDKIKSRISDKYFVKDTIDKLIYSVLRIYINRRSGIFITLKNKRDIINSSKRK